MTSCGVGGKVRGCGMERNQEEVNREREEGGESRRRTQMWKHLAQ